MRIHILALSAVLLCAGIPAIGRRPLTFQERVKAQEAIERVYYAHRIWPKENPGPKPPFEQMMPKTQIEAEVTDYLKKCAALDRYWQRPLTGDQLQAEMDRMAKGTQNAATLLELFAALDNDPDLIAECLVRPILADRLIRNWFAYDGRFHGERGRQAQTALAAGNLAWASLPGIHYERGHRTLVESIVPRISGGEGTSASWELDEEVFRRWMGEVPAEGQSVLRETEEGFILIHTERIADNRWDGERGFLEKRSWDDWWNETQRDLLPEDGSIWTEGRRHPPILKVSWPQDCGIGDGWAQQSSLLNAMEPVFSNKAVWTGAEMIVWGGSAYGSTLVATGGRYNPSTDSWLPTSTGTNCPAKRNYHTAVWTGSEMIVWGGQNSSVQLQTGGRYNPTSDSWLPTPTGIDCPTSRFSHAAVWTGTEMIIWGGYGSNANANTGGRYSPSLDSWAATSTASGCPTPRNSVTAVWTGSEMIVWGGWDGSNANTGGRYNPLTDSWVATNTGMGCPVGRSNHSAVWTGSEMIIWGGMWYVTDYVYENTGGRYDPVADAWTATATGANCPTERDAHSAVWTGSEMIVWGGGDYVQYLKTGGRYSPATDTWAATSIGANCPSARDHHGAIWTGTEMIVWGGLNGSTGARYNPSSDSWVIASGPRNPTQRYSHTGIWTGAEAIIWGGNGSSYLQTGGLYNPATDSWTPTSTAVNCPTGRYAHSAVWTGIEMLVWGGYGYSYLQTGGGYSPITDTWRTLPTSAGVPTGRSGHTAVWTGTEMIVWGGYGATYYNTGARYSPSLNTWTPTTTGTNCPTARNNHTAVWTGTEMIVWGGITSYATWTNTGGRYNSVTDTWGATSTGSGCPTARSRHSAIWTGTELIVWGGGGWSSVNSGGRYFPASDSWVPTSTGANCATARDSHVAVWTGDEMIVWGGYGINAYLNTGGRYTPASDSWLATATGTGCPIGRNSPTALWTGTEMMIWGGFRDGAQNSGGMYQLGVTVSGLSSFCEGEGTLRTQLYSSYQWRNDGVDIAGATAQTFTPTESGAYSVAVIDTNGCTGVSSEKSVTVVMPPAPMVTGGASACASAGVALSTEAFATYQWRRDGVSIAGATAQSYTATTSGDYSVRVTNASGCEGTSASHAVVIYPNPNPVVAGPSPACSSASLSTGSFASYRWYRNGSPVPGATSATYWAPAPGTYTVAVADTNGCGATSAAFVVHGLPTPVIEGPSSGCGSVSLSSGAYSSYQWSRNGAALPGATSQTLVATESGSYSLLVTDSLGCSASALAKSVTILPLPEATVTGPHFNACPATTVSLSAPSGLPTYQWYRNGSPIVGANGRELVVTVSSDYSVAVVGPNGCAASSGGYSVFIDFCPTSEVSPALAIYPVRAVKDASSTTGYFVYFQRLETLDGYHLYEGTLGGPPYNHGNAAGNSCALAAEDLGTGEMRAAITPTAGDHYYLVTAYGNGVEGPSGFDSQGQEIPAAQSTCLP